MFERNIVKYTTALIVGLLFARCFGHGFLDVKKYPVLLKIFGALKANANADNLQFTK